MTHNKVFRNISQQGLDKWKTNYKDKILFRQAGSTRETSNFNLFNLGLCNDIGTYIHNLEHNLMPISRTNGVKVNYLEMKCHYILCQNAELKSATKLVTNGSTYYGH